MGHVKAESSPCSTPHRNIPPSPWWSFQTISGWLPIVDKPLHQWYPFKHGVSHHIVTEGWPIFAPLQRFSPEKLVATNSLTWELCAHRPAHGPLHSTWSPKAMVNGAHMGTTAGWMTSQLLIFYPIPHIQDFASNLAGKTIFTKKDLVHAYHQISVTADDFARLPL